MQDLRRVAYADFVEEAANVEFSQTPSSVDKLLGAEAQAELYADSDVRNAARAVSDAVRQMGDCDPDVEDCYGQAVGQFLDAAKAQLEAEE